MLARLLADAVALGRRHALLMTALALALAALAGGFAARHLGVDTDTDHMFAASLPWRQNEIAFARAFPTLSDPLVVVIDAAIPEEAEATAAALAQTLAADPAHFRAVTRPDALPFFAREGLLFLDRADLGQLLDRIIDAQPFLGQLAADPSARGLFSALALIGMGVAQGEADLTPYLPALQSFHATLAASADGHPAPLSWQRLIGGGKLADLAGRYRFVLVQPVLDHGALAPGKAASDAIRAAAAGLPFVAAGRAHVRLTGEVALDDEEFSSLAQGMLFDTLASLALIALWLALAVRGLRLILPILATLGLGLALTTGFAALAVGTLNLVSLAFAILFVGIAVDFAIQFTVRYREAHHDIPDSGAALAATARAAGGPILIAATATAAGFYAFVPTAFAGVAELGLIAGTGMIIAFLCTILFLPAFLTLARPQGEARAIGFAAGDALERRLDRGRAPLLTGFAALALLGLFLLPHLGFDSDPLHTKNPHGEAMRTLHDLMDDPLTNPTSIDILTPDADAADQLAARLDHLPQVADVLTLDRFVPADQPAKLALIQDAASVLATTLAPRETAPVTADQIRLAIATARSALAPALQKLPQDHPLTRIDADLARLAAAPDAALMAMNGALTRFLPEELARLRIALAAKAVTRADLPPEIIRDWRSPDGRVRVEALATPAGHDSAGLAAFVAAVRAIAPTAGGMAVIIVETSATIITAFTHAVIGALAAIAVILLAALRRPRDAALVLAPLLLSALLTVVGIRLAGMTLNFANIIALPLLLGVGVSFNIYFVMNWREGATRFLGTATARAILFSAATTGTAFGSLALSHHPGTASLGALLLLSLACTLIATLVFEPLMLAITRR